MDLNNSLFGMPFIAGIGFIIAGLITSKFPPKKINMLYGYRTSSSMKNQKQWDFAQLYSSKIMLLGGIGLIGFSSLGLIFEVSEKTGSFIGFAMLITFILILLVLTERAIKQRFGDEA